MADDNQGDILSTEHALITGAALLLDEIFDGIVHVCNGASLEETLAGCLPPQFHYDGYFLRRFLICAVRVADRLAVWEDGPIPACTAECLALRAIVDRAVLQMRAEEQKDDEGGHTARTLCTSPPSASTIVR